MNLLKLSRIFNTYPKSNEELNKKLPCILKQGSLNKVKKLNLIFLFRVLDEQFSCLLKHSRMACKMGFLYCGILHR